jgi:hypothetical protein
MRNARRDVSWRLHTGLKVEGTRAKKGEIACHSGGGDGLNKRPRIHLRKIGVY